MGAIGCRLETCAFSSLIFLQIPPSSSPFAVGGELGGVCTLIGRFPAFLFLNFFCERGSGLRGACFAKTLGALAVTGEDVKLIVWIFERFTSGASSSLELLVLVDSDRERASFGRGAVVAVVEPRPPHMMKSSPSADAVDPQAVSTMHEVALAVLDSSAVQSVQLRRDSVTLWPSSRRLGVALT